MIEFMSSWASGIVISLIIATILEMMLPEGNNKKYIKVVIGVYILFTIISPLIAKFQGKELDLQNMLNIDKTLTSLNTIQTSSIDTDSSIEQVFMNNLKQDMRSKLKEKGYDAENITLVIDFKDEKNYGKIKEITLFLKENKQPEKSNIVTNEIEEINIAVNSDANSKDIKEEPKKLSDSQIKEIKEYLSSVYDVNKEKIFINV